MYKDYGKQTGTAGDHLCVLHLRMQARLTLTAGLAGEAPAQGRPRGLTGTSAGLQTQCRCVIAAAEGAQRGGVCCAPVWRRRHMRWLHQQLSNACKHKARPTQDCMGHFRNALSWQSCNLCLVEMVKIIA